MSMNFVVLAYLIASVCFIQALKGLSHPTTSIRGNLFGMVGMAIAALTTVALIGKLAADLGQANPWGGLSYVLLGLVIGGGLGAYMAAKVEMTKMPECIAVAAVAEPYALIPGLPRGADIPLGNRLELCLGAAIGAITFSGSVIAFGKLSGKYKFRLFQGAPVQFKGQHALNAVLGLAMLGLIVYFMATENWTAFVVVCALAFVLGVLIIIPIGVAAATTLGVSPRPVLMSIAVAAAASFLTPIATPTNLMVMGPGGYQFSDYWKLGLPLLIWFFLVATFYVPLVWRF